MLMLGVLTPFFSRAADTTITPVPRIQAPPAGKALVNIHNKLRKDPFAFGHTICCPIFDESEKFLMDLPVQCECQLVCEPGQKVFITWFGVNPDDVTAMDLAPDKTYDLLLYLNWKGTILIPLSQASARMRSVEDLERDEKVYALERNEVALKYEAAQKGKLDQIKKDFLGGRKSGRVVHVNINDCRPSASSVITKLCEQLDSANPNQVVDALKRLRKPEDSAATPKILPLLNHRNAKVVRDACRTLAVIASKDVIPQIEPLLQDKRADVRKDAQDAINKLSAVSSREPAIPPSP